ncbi:MAG: glycoside hydrolase family 2 [Verrucomicrobiales bacterium]|nr:glycoside hydrolase family 2 [Verrucomicrobiales bacterium]
MKNIFPLLFAAALTVSAADIDGWQPKQAPIMTRFAADIDPKLPLPEYPRPQLVRGEWLNLNGIWQVQPGADAAPVGRNLPGKILVPFAVESALSGVMEHHDRLWYRRTFSVPAAWAGKRVWLHFGAVDYEAEVFVNGRSLGTHKGGYDPFALDITEALRADGQQELIVRVFDPTEAGGQPRGKQTTKPNGIMYTPTTGIWQTVWLEPADRVSVRSLRMTPDVDGGALRLTVSVSAPQGVTVSGRVLEGAAVVKEFSGAADTELVVPLPNAKLWSPEQPFLYDLALTLTKDGKVTDSVTSYFGMRKIELRDVGGVRKVFLNNEFVFQAGVLDQGFWPDGIYTSPTEEALKFDIEQTKALGFNMSRKHIKVEPQRWYYWADKLGLLVWQDMPSENSYFGDGPRPALEKDQYELELRRMVGGLFNHPSIIAWVTFNESQGQFDAHERKSRSDADTEQGRAYTARMVNAVRSLDPTRLINEASGDENFGLADFNDRHAYPPPTCPENTFPNQAIACGEYGGIGYRVEGHMWEQRGGGYSNVESGDDLVFLYADFFARVQKFRDERGMSASVYTQLTDVMTEVNGLLTYDRVPKCDFARIKKVNKFKFAPPAYKAVMPAADDEPQLWKHTMVKPEGGDWRKLDYNDAAWSEGRGGFGRAHQTVTNTPWQGAGEIWLRRKFTVSGLTPERRANLVLKIYHDDGADVFINGVHAYGNGGVQNAYEYRGLKASARAAVADGENIIAIRCWNKGGGQHIDAGLCVREPRD